MLNAGGTAVGEIVALATAAGARVTRRDVNDSEGNTIAIALLAWA